MNGSNSNTSGATVATLDFKPAVPGDVIGDKQMREIVRRLQVTNEGRSDSDIFPGTTAPSDLTLIWWPTDPTSGTRIGKPKTYDSELGQWVELGQGTERQFNRFVTGIKGVSAGNSTVNFDFNGWQTKNYHISLTPTIINGDTVLSTPADLNNFHWVVSNKANDQFTVMFYAVPAGGLNIQWKVEEIDPTKA